MQYENYQRRIQKVAVVLSRIVRMLPLIIAITATVIAAVVALLAFMGTVGEVKCSDEVAYGETLDCRSFAFLSKVRYEYASADGDEWSAQYPKLPGEYKVRAVGKTVFGKDRYGEVTRFTVTKKTVTVSVAESEIVYGNKPGATAQLAYDDVLEFGDMIYSDEVIPHPGDYTVAMLITATPDREHIRILDKDGNDVSYAYNVETVSSTLTILKREITVVVEDATRQYNGMEFTFDAYELREGTLAEGDRLVATFDASLVDVGSVVNAPMLQIITEQGTLRSQFYIINKQFGKLTVEQRPLIIHMPSYELEYDGTTHTFYEYELDESTPLVEGHVLSTLGLKLKDSGTYENTMSFYVHDKDPIRNTSASVTHNYAFFIDVGEIVINKKQVIVETASGEWTYDGEYHSMPEFTPTGLIEGHTMRVNYQSQICDAGVMDNKLGFDIFDENGLNVNKNYSVGYRYGELVMNARHIDVYTASAEWVYDGQSHSDNGCWAEGLVDGHYVDAYATVPHLIDVGTLTNEFKVRVCYLGEFEGFEAEYVVPDYNYNITYHYGTLEVKKRPITINTANADWIFDGEDHAYTGFEITSPLGLADGEWAEVISWKTVRDVCNTDNEYSEFKIWRYPYNVTYPMPEVDPDYVYIETTTADPEEETEYDDIWADDSTGFIDSTQNYEITWVYGKLVIEPRPITVKPVYAEKVYDATPLDPTDVELANDSPYTLVDGHRLDSPVFDQGRTDAGQWVSTIIDCKIMNGDVDETLNYDVTYQEGELFVYPREITVFTGSARKYYDGTPLTNADFGVIPEKLYDLVEGHEITVYPVGEQIEIGESQNYCEEWKTQITSPKGDVTHNYSINYEYGRLCVDPLAVIYVTSASDWKYYDGEPLVNKTYEVVYEKGSLSWGHLLSVSVSGEITEIGSTANTVTARVVDMRGNDVSEKYVIVTQEGLLEVVGQDSSGGDLDLVVGQIMTSNGGFVYLRQQSYGSYNGRGWNQAAEYWKTLPGGYSYNYLASIAARNAGVSWNSAEFDGMLMYMLPYYMDMGGAYSPPASDTVYSSDSVWYWCGFYDLSDLEDGYEWLKGNLGEYADYEADYREFVYRTYLSLDSESLEYMQGIIAEQGFDINDPLVISKIAGYVQNAAEYDLEYDKAMDLESNVAIAFLDSYKKGICVHYASAATLLYRALGIPARYVEGFALQTVAGEFVDITTPGHAWVEVYVDGVGWIEVEVTGGMSGGGGGGAGGGGEDGGEKPRLEIQPLYRWKYYDGEPLYATAELALNDALQELFDKGYWCSISVSGSQTEIGLGVSRIETFSLFDAQGNDVTADYEIIRSDGRLEVLAPEQTVIRVYLYSLQKYYDGLPLRFEDGDYEVIDEISGISLSLQLNIEMTEVGALTLSEINSAFESYASYKVYSYGNDVTANYKVIFDTFDGWGVESYTPIAVDKRAITLTAASQTKVDDGTPLENGNVIISSAGLVGGHYVEAVLTGYIDTVGEVENGFESIVIRDADGNDVTNNYDIKIVVGTLTILPEDD